MAEGDVHPGMFPEVERKLTEGNIVLDYPCVIERSLQGEGESEVYYSDKAEFFMDEHGFQWVKFVAKNGYHSGKEHMIRTDAVGFTFIRYDYAVRS